jgi:probable HAF family extracellular repeat protein
LLSYSITDLGTLGGDFSLAFGVNDVGQVVGDSAIADHNPFHAFLYGAGMMSDLGTLGTGQYSQATGINASGQVVGSGYIDPGNSTTHAFLDSGGTLFDLTPQAFYSVASGINDSGIIVGDSQPFFGAPGHAFRYHDGVLTDLGTLGGYGSSAKAISPSGLIVGSSSTDGDRATHAFTADDFGMRDLGTLGGTNSEALAVNSRGDVVGDASPAGDVGRHAFLYCQSRMTDLGSLGQGTYTTATGINDAGQVVGWGFIDPGNSTQHAFLDNGGTMTDLNNLIPSGSGWTLHRAFGINNAGQIVGDGERDGLTHGFLLTLNRGVTFGTPTLYDIGGLADRVAVGDFNGDGIPDLAVANNSGNSVSVLLGNGDGTFRRAVNYPAGPNPYWLAVGDFNGDGNLDVVVANYTSSAVTVLLGNGDGTFQAPLTDHLGTDILPYSLTVGDFNGDGNLDVVTANAYSQDVSVLLGHGDGTFDPPVNYNSGGFTGFVTVADFNRDGIPDLAVSNNLGVGILTGNGDGTFQQAVTYPVPGGLGVLVAADFNGDGVLDLAATNYLYPNGLVTVLLGNPDGSFGAPVNYPVSLTPASIAVGDFNGDGIPDLVTANNYSASVSVLLGNGDGTFQTRQDFGTGGIFSESVAVGDFNGDGLPDLAVANVDSDNVSVLLNVSAGPAVPTEIPPIPPPGQSGGGLPDGSQRQGASATAPSPGDHPLTALPVDRGPSKRSTEASAHRLAQARRLVSWVEVSGGSLLLLPWQGQAPDTGDMAGWVGGSQVEPGR